MTDDRADKDEADDGQEIVRAALDLYEDYRQREADNLREGYDDLEFRAGNQWPEDVRKLREIEGRPCQTINQMPQYVRQVTGDMRQMRPAIKVVPVDDNGDEDKAEVLEGVVRYVENRSDAPAVYFQGADSQVACGVGAWRVTTEYAHEGTFNQEIRIAPIEDALGVMWDGNSILPTREDAMECLVPFDMTRRKFKREYPDATASDFAPSEASGLGHSEWSTSDTVRVGEYWYKEKAKRVLALMADGAIEDVTEDKAYAAELAANGVRIERRDSYKVFRALVTATEVIEGPDEWPGSFIPIVPVIGEEIRIGRRIVRHGVIRFAKDPQRTYNYMSSAQTEVIALQPKAPFTGTDKNFENHEDIWQTANVTNHPYLPYTPDPANGSIAPQRVQPAVSSQGVAEGIERAGRDMQSVIGIYNASLGAASNETSGRAVLARQREGDTGTFVYIDNWARAIRHTGKIVVDLIPKVYDTARVLRIIGEDGKLEEHRINQVGGMDAEGNLLPMNDVTTGSYDVSLQMGPSYSTKREEAREGMTAFVQAAPQVAPLILDLVAKSQDWHLAEEISERLETVLPPEIRAAKAEKEGKPLPQSMQPPPPDPVQQQLAQWEMQSKEAEMFGKQADARKKEADARKAEIELEGAMIAPLLPQPAPAPATPPQQAVQQPDETLERMAGAIMELQQTVGEIIQAIQQPSMQEMPPDPMPEMMPMEQPPVEAAFLMPEQPAPPPQF